MKISDLIHILQQAQTDHGDLEVGYYDHEGRYCHTVKVVNIRHKWSYQDDDKLGKKFVALEDQLID
jgi:hypothetical protein